jgi:hypothetical protein
VDPTCGVDHSLAAGCVRSQGIAPPGREELAVFALDVLAQPTLPTALADLGKAVVRDDPGAVAAASLDRRRAGLGCLGRSTQRRVDDLDRRTVGDRQRRCSAGFGKAIGGERRLSLSERRER